MYCIGSASSEAEGNGFCSGFGMAMLMNTQPFQQGDVQLVWRLRFSHVYDRRRRNAAGMIETTISTSIILQYHYFMSVFPVSIIWKCPSRRTGPYHTFNLYSVF
jgi:hypothetical protein